MEDVLPKGQKTPLLHTKKARERIVAGLSWDAREDKVGMFGRVKGDSQHDLDINCYIYNKDGECIDYVGSEAQDSMDESEKIYHSGDDQSGAGDGDDEFISAELAKLPKSVYGIVFIVEIRSQHVFTDVATPFARIADGFDDKNLLEINIGGDDASASNAFIMCAIQRMRTSPTGWQLYNISEFPDVSKIDSWGTYLSQFID
jgi:stress response protein SCP2